MNKYQQPLRSRWQYEFIAAKQYLERREIHLKFVEWFLPKLKNLKKAPITYIQKWELFQNWLNDFELNIEIQCLVKFGQKIYHPITEFLVGYDPQLRIQVYVMLRSTKWLCGSEEWVSLTSRLRVPSNC